MKGRLWGSEESWSLSSCTISNDRIFKEAVSHSLGSYLSLLAKMFSNTKTSVKLIKEKEIALQAKLNPYLR